MLRCTSREQHLFFFGLLQIVISDLDGSKNTIKHKRVLSYKNTLVELVSTAQPTLRPRWKHKTAGYIMIPVLNSFSIKATLIFNRGWFSLLCNTVLFV